MRAEEIQGLMEAYSKVNATPEVLSEGVVEEDIEVLDEAPMTAFQAAGGQAKLDQLNKGRSPRAGRVTAAQIEKQGQENLFKAGGGNAAIAKGPTRSQNIRGGGTRQVPTLTRQDIINRGTVAAAKPAAKPGTPTPAPTKPGNTGTPTPAPTKPGNTTGGKPTTPAAPQKPKGSAMDQWRAANPKLAAAADEKARIRGTSQTDNPLMKDMRSKMPMTPSVQSPAVAKLGAGNQSLVNNPNASKAATPKPAAAAKPTTPAPSTAKTGFDLAKKGVNLAAGVDIFDLVKGHLLDEGYAETEEGAMVIMVNMSEEWRKSILEAHGVELDEAQEAREKPEEHEEKEEKENEKKYGHVRGEKTPMPPRGDKRREEFEKWYAKQGR
jgi:hypothetical protein